MFLNSGGGRLKNRIDYSTRPGANGVGVHSVAIGDLNRDGKLDLVTLKPASVLVLPQQNSRLTFIHGADRLTNVPNGQRHYRRRPARPISVNGI